jgi:hypothetical protein
MDETMERYVEILGKIKRGENLEPEETEFLEGLTNNFKKQAVDAAEYEEDTNRDPEEPAEVIDVEVPGKETPKADSSPAYTDEEMQKAKKFYDYMQSKGLSYSDVMDKDELTDFSDGERAALYELASGETKDKSDKEYTPEQQTGIEEANKADDELKAKREAFGEKVREAGNTLKRYNSSKDHDGVTKEEAESAKKFLSDLRKDFKAKKPESMSYKDSVDDTIKNKKIVEANSLRNQLGAHDENNELIEDEHKAVEAGEMDPADVSIYQKIFDKLKAQKKGDATFNDAWRNIVENDNELVNQMMNNIGDDMLYSRVVGAFKNTYDRMDKNEITPENAAAKLYKSLMAAQKRRITGAMNQANLINDLATNAKAKTVDKDVGEDGKVSTKVTGIEQPGAKGILKAETPVELAEAMAEQDAFNKDVRKMNYGYSNLGNLPSDTESQKAYKDAVLDRAARWVTNANEARNNKYDVEDFLEMYDKHPNIEWIINGTTNAYRGGQRLNLILKDPDNESLPEKAITLTGNDVQTFLNSIQEADRDIPVSVRIVNRDIRARDQGEDDNTKKYANRYKNMLKYANPSFVFGDPTVQEFNVLPYGLDTTGLTADQINFLKTPIDRDTFGKDSTFRVDNPDYYGPLSDVIKNSSDRGLKAYYDDKDINYKRVNEMKPVYKDWGATDKQYKESGTLGNKDTDIAKPISYGTTLSSSTAKREAAQAQEDLFTPISAKSMADNNLYDLMPNTTVTGDNVKEIPLGDDSTGKMSWGLEDTTTGLPVLIKVDEDPDTGISTYKDVRTGLTYPVNTDAGDIPSQLKAIRQKLLDSQSEDLYPYDTMHRLPDTTQKLARMRFQNAVNLLNALEDPEDLEKEGRPFVERQFLNTPSALRILTNRISDLFKVNPDNTDLRKIIEEGNLTKLTREGNLRDIFGPINSISRDDDKHYNAKQKLRNLIKAYLLLDNYDATRQSIPWEDMRNMLDGEINNLGKLNGSNVPEGMDVKDLLDTFKNARTIVTKGSEIYGGAMDRKSLNKRLKEINAPLELKKKELAGKKKEELTDEEKEILDKPLLSLRDYKKQLEQNKLDFNQDFYNAMASEVGKRYDAELGDALSKMPFIDRVILEGEKADRAKAMTKKNGATMSAALKFIFEPLANAGVEKAKTIVDMLNSAAPSSAQLANTGYNALVNLIGMTPDQANIYLNNKNNPDKKPNDKILRGKAKNYYSPYSDASRLLDAAQNMLVEAEHTDDVKKLVKQAEKSTINRAAKGDKDALNALKQSKENKNLANQIYDGLSGLLNR